VTVCDLECEWDGRNDNIAFMDSINLYIIDYIFVLVLSSAEKVLLLGNCLLIRVPELIRSFAPLSDNCSILEGKQHLCPAPADF